MTISDSANGSAAPDARPHFPLAQGREKGYQRAAVDVFLARAKEAFESEPPSLDAASVRAASFPVVRGGYRIVDVDAALARIEDAFAQRERTTALSQRGARAWVRRARTQAQVILDHLGRPSGQRFARTSVLTWGYRVDEVDHVADRIVGYLRDGDALSAEQVRNAAFRMQRRGYREEQVDALLDATIEVLLAVR